ncbi:MAG: hypothetical protein JWP30_1901 [Homoserinimonas sp.]|nr:hypothetical protein [Homoserinimonas sp.]
MAVTETASREARNLARGGLLSFVGASVSALAGFFLTVVLARSLGDSGTGIVLQAIAVFSIVLSLARAGMDSVAIWLLPRLVHSDTDQLRGALSFMLVTVSVAGSILGATLVVGAANVARNGDENGKQLAEALAAIGWLLPVAALALVALGATRGLGAVLPHVVINSLALPLIRLICVATLAAAGASVAAIALGWAAPVGVAFVAVILVVRFQVARTELVIGSRGNWWPDTGMRRRIAAFALPRTLSSGLEQAILWLDVLIVGFIAGSAAAGIYGTASRLIAAGLIVDTALRIVVSPRFSALLHSGELAKVEALYRTAARWLVLFGAPIYLVLGLYAPVILRWFGPEFVEGAPALTVLCLGAVITFMAGNIHSMLLMSGRSGWAAFNKCVVLMINVAGNVVLVPTMGIIGAALSWAVSMLIDAVLASIEVRRLLGVTVELKAVMYALAIPVLTIGMPGAICLLLWGPGHATLLLTLAVGAVLYTLWCGIDARRLQLADVAIFARKR